MTWKSQPKTCRKCGYEKEKDGFSWCKNCREDIEAMIMSSTGSTIKVSWFRLVSKSVSKLVSKSVSKLAIRMIVRFYKWRERREEERDVEMLINKAGARE